MNKKLAAISFFALSFLAGNEVVAANYVQASVEDGVFIVNQTNGKITFCSTLINASTYQPQGQCKTMGTISTTNLAGNVQINSGSTANLVAVVTNLSTGATVRCGLYVDPTSGVPVSGCLSYQVP